MLKLSVIVPYYNSERWISRCLDSLLHQDLAEDEYEIIVVDDGSTGDARLLKGYAQSHANIHYVWQENGGASAARNKGLTLAKGDYVFFCDSDDFVAENVLGHLYDIAMTNRTDILFFGHMVIQEGEQPQPKLNFDQVTIYDPGINIMLTPPYKTVSCPWEYFIKREYIEKRHLTFIEGMIMAEDHYFYREMMSDVGRVGKVETEVYYWVKRASSISHSKGKELLKRYNGYEKGLYQHLCHLIKFRNHLFNKYIVPSQVRVILDNSKDDASFSILILYFRYFTFKENLAMINKMNQLGVFPIHHDYLKHLNYSQSKRFVLKTVGQLMNIHPLWLTACALFHCLPERIRYKF